MKKNLLLLVALGSLMGTGTVWADSAPPNLCQMLLGQWQGVLKDSTPPPETIYAYTSVNFFNITPVNNNQYNVLAQVSYDSLGGHYGYGATGTCTIDSSGQAEISISNWGFSLNVKTNNSGFSIVNANGVFPLDLSEHPPVNVSGILQKSVIGKK